MALRHFLQSKIHRAVVTEADIHYVGSIGIDEDLMDAAGLDEYEQVHVAGLDGGHRLITYAIKAPRGSGIITMNGAAARLIKKGEMIIIFSYAMLDAAELEDYKPRIVLIGQDNKIDKIVEGEIQGQKIPLS